MKNFWKVIGVIVGVLGVAVSVLALLGKLSVVADFLKDIAEKLKNFGRPAVMDDLESPVVMDEEF